MVGWSQALGWEAVDYAGMALGLGRMEFDLSGV